MRFLLAHLLCFAAAFAADAKKAESAPPSSEDLMYSVNWPTGLSLGEARLTTRKTQVESAEHWALAFSLDASVPGFAVTETAKSDSDSGFCSAQLDKQYSRGKRKSEETTTFDQQKLTARRETKGGGKSDLSTTQCARDALAYLAYLRRELGAGRLPPHQTVYFGAPYRISVQFAGSQQIALGESRVAADKLLATLKGEKVDLTFEIYFSKDAARTPLLVKVPLQLATFSMELVR